MKQPYNKRGNIKAKPIMPPKIIKKQMKPIIKHKNDETHVNAILQQATSLITPIIKPLILPLKNELPPLTDDIWIKAAPHKPLDTKPHWRKFKDWIEWKKREEMRKNSPDKIILIRMEMNNGFFREFLAVEDIGSFIYKKARYVLDMEQKYYIIERNLWAYDFHESISLPIRKKIRPTEEVETLLNTIEEAYRKPLSPKVPVNEIKKLIESSKVVDVENSLNPSTLRQFTDSEVIKQVLQGAMLGKIFKIMFVLIIIILIFVFLDTIVSMYASGVFDKISGMFHKGD